MQADSEWIVADRPGYFGRRKPLKIAQFDANFGEGNWKLAWHMPGGYPSSFFSFEEACKNFYEYSYLQWFKERPEEVDNVCSYAECIDNASTNVTSGLDYTKQESFSNHIQDIAVRNVLASLGRTFQGPPGKILVIRSADSDGYKYGPGNIPFFDPALILAPSKCPSWAGFGSVEDFWQSNKVLLVKSKASRGTFQGEF